MTGTAKADNPQNPENPLDSKEAGGKVIRGGSLRAASYVVSLVVGLVSAPLLVRYLSVEEFGLFVTVNAIVFVVGGLSEGGLGSVALREFTQGAPTDRTSILRNLLGLRLGLSLGTSAFAVAFAALVGYPTVVMVGVAISSIGLLAGGAQTAWGTALQADLKLGWLSVADLTRQLATTVGLVALVVVGASLTAFFAVYSVGMVVMLGVTIVAAGRWRRLWPSFDLRRWAALLRQTLIFAIATAAGLAYFQVAIVSTSLLAGDREAGLYGASFRILELVNGVPWLVVATAFPLIARAAATDLPRLRYGMQRLFDTSLLLGGLFAVAVVVGAPVALDVIGGAKLEDAVPVLQVLGVALPFRFLVATWGYGLLAVHRERALLTVNAGAFFASVVLSVLLIPPFGAMGAALVTVFLELMLTAGLFSALGRQGLELRPELRGVRRAVLWLGAAVGLGLLVPIPAVPATALALVLFVGGMARTGGVPAEIAEAVRERAPRRAVEL